MLTFRNRLSGVGFVRYRLPWLLAECTDKKVLDVGCAGAGYFEHRFRSGTALHPCLAGVSERILGIDIDGDALAVLRHAGCDQVIEADLSEYAAAVIAEVERRMGGCDLVVCGEVLEHASDAGRLLAGVRTVAKHFNAQVILTVPNAFSLVGFLWLCAGVEAVHPDHKCYYSWRTIQSLLQRSELGIVRMFFYADEVRGASRNAWVRAAKQFLGATFFRLLPQLGQGLIVIARSE